MIQAIERTTIHWTCPECEYEDNEITVKETSGTPEVLQCCNCEFEDEFEIVQ